MGGTTLSVALLLALAVVAANLPFVNERLFVFGPLRTPAKSLGWRYDASSPGGRQVWPQKKLGIWDLPLQQIPFPGRSFEVLSMDYNMLANQSVNSTNAPAYNYPAWRTQASKWPTDV